MKKILSPYFGSYAFITAILSMTLPLFLASKGLNEKIIGNLYFIATIIAAITIVLLFTLSDIFGRRSLFILFPVFLLSASLLVWNKYIGFILIAILLFVIAQRGIFILINTTSMQHFKKEMSKSSGQFYIAANIGSVVGTTIGGVILKIKGFSYLFLICIVVSLLPILLALLIDNIKTVKRFNFKIKFGRKYFVLIAHKLLANLGIGMVFAFALPLFLSKVHNQPPVSIGIILALYTLFNIIGYSFAKYADKYNYHKINYISIIIASLAFVNIALAPNVIIVMILLAIYALSMSMAGASIIRFYNEVIRQAGRDVSIIEALGDTAGWALAAPLAGFIIYSFGYSVMFIVSGIILFSAMIVLITTFGIKHK